MLPGRRGTVRRVPLVLVVAQPEDFLDRLVLPRSLAPLDKLPPWPRLFRLPHLPCLLALVLGDPGTASSPLQGGNARIRKHSAGRVVWVVRPAGGVAQPLRHQGHRLDLWIVHPLPPLAP